MRFHRGRDGWGRDSYPIPQYAVIGCSDCGNHSDSPAPHDLAEIECEMFRKVLRKAHIRSRICYSQSGNIFMVKRWVVVHSKDYERANELAKQFLAEHKSDTRLVHEAV